MIQPIIRQWFALVRNPDDIASDQLKKVEIDLLYAHLDMEACEARVDRLNATRARLLGRAMPILTEEVKT